MYEVDMSGKIEETNKPTVVALAGKMSYSLYISATEKQKLLKVIRARQPKWSRTKINVYIFAALLFFLLKDHIEKIDLVTIDLEYQGHDGVIKNRLISSCKKVGIWIEKEKIAFASITKKSPAHHLAYSVFKGARLPNVTISSEQVLDTFGV